MGSRWRGWKVGAIAAVLMSCGALGVPTAQAAMPVPIGLTPDSSAGFPQVAVDSSGNADFVWTADDSTLSIQFCQIPAGGSACTKRATLSGVGGPDGATEGIPIVGESILLGAGQTIYVVSDGAFSSSAYSGVWVWTSTDGGTTWENDGVGQHENGSVPGSGFDIGKPALLGSTILTPSQNGTSTLVQGTPVSGPQISAEAALAAYPDATGTPAVAVQAGKPIVVVQGQENTTDKQYELAYYQLAAGADPNLAASWGQQTDIGQGEFVFGLAPGPSGAALLSDFAGDPAAVRMFNGTGFGAPVAIGSLDACGCGARISQSPETGQIDVVYNSGGTLHYASSTNGGTSFTNSVVGSAEVASAELDVASGPAGSAWAVYAAGSGGQGLYALPLTGSAASSATSINVSPSSLDFGEAAVTSTTASQTTFITNTGGQSATVTPSLTGADASDFQLVTDGCSGISLSPGQVCEVAVAFKPETVASDSATLSIADGAANSPQLVPLTGVGVSTPGVQGSVVDNHGKPLGALVIVCPQPAHNDCQYTSTDASGGYRIIGLKPGSWSVQVSPKSDALLGKTAKFSVAGAIVTENFVLSPPMTVLPGTTIVGATSSNGVPAVSPENPFSITLPWPVPMHVAPSGPGGGNHTKVYAADLSLGEYGGPSSAGTIVVLSVAYHADGDAFRMSSVFGGPAAPGSTTPDLAAVARAFAVGLRGGRYATEAAGCGSGIVPNSHGGITLMLGGVSIPFYPLLLPVPTPNGHNTLDVVAPLAINAAIGLNPYVNGYNSVVGGLNILANISSQTTPTQGVSTATALALTVATSPISPLSGTASFVATFAAGDYLASNPAPSQTSPPSCEPVAKTASAGFNMYIDPSGTVRTPAGIPLQGARVILSRSAQRNGRFVKLPKGSAIMSPANRRNPDHTDILGDFGWDVLPGFYRVAATHSGCKSGHTPVLAVPPPALRLDVILRCGPIRRAASATKLRVLRATRGGAVELVATVSVDRRRRASGDVTFKAGRRTLASAAVNSRTGRAIAIAVLGPKQHGVVASYGGDASASPSRS